MPSHRHPPTPAALYSWHHLKGQIPEQYRFKLQWVLIIPFVIQVTATVGLTGWLTIRNGQQAVNDLAVQLQDQVRDRIDQHLHTYLEIPQWINDLNAEAIRLGDLNLNDPEALERTFWQQLKNSTTIDSIYWGDQTRGGYIGTHRVSSTQINYETTRNYQAGDFMTEATDHFANRTKTVSINPNYDPRKRPWYQEAVADQTSGWSEIYSFFPMQELGITATLPLYDSTGKLQGVLAADLALTGIRDFLQALPILQTGETFLMASDGLIIAASHTDQIVRSVPHQDNPQRLHLSELDHPILRNIGQQIATQSINLSTLQEPLQLRLRIDRRRYFVQITPVGRDLGLDWLAGVIIPEVDFMGRIEANTRITLGLCTIALFGAVALGWITSRWIAWPVLQLSNRSRAITQDSLSSNFQHLPAVTSDRYYIEELEQLAQSFAQMTDQLQGSLSALEKSNAELEHRVEERTEDLSKTLDHLRKTQAHLVQTEKMSSLGKLVAGIAHEINNPVNFINGNLCHLQDHFFTLLQVIAAYHQEYSQPSEPLTALLAAADLDFLEEDLPKTLESMKNGSDRIRTIVQSLRTFSRLDESEFKTVDVHAGLESTLLILQSQLQRSGTLPSIEVIRDYGDLPLIECYAGDLNQVFMNLLTNAIDALCDRFSMSTVSATCASSAGLAEESNPPLCPQLRIQTRSYSSDYNPGIPIVEIRIQDNGQGMTPQVRDHIFDPFYTTKPVGQGTGLGLSISYQIVVDQHGGDLRCESRWGEGTTLIVRLPGRSPQPRQNDTASDTPRDGLRQG